MIVYGESKSQPFCNGLHEGSAFQPAWLTVTEPARYRPCGCKHSNNQPLCDGVRTELD